MDSHDAQCLLIQLAEGEVPPPQHWRHERSGDLSCHYEEATRAFTWRAEEVARMAHRWRTSDVFGPALPVMVSTPPAVMTSSTSLCKRVAWDDHTHDSDRHTR